MMEIEMPKIAVEENEERSYAKIVVEPLEKGFGLTPKPFRSFYYFLTLSMYSPVRVSIRITSPSFTNMGT